ADRARPLRRPRSPHGRRPRPPDHRPPRRADPLARPRTRRARRDAARRPRSRAARRRRRGQRPRRRPAALRRRPRALPGDTGRGRGRRAVRGAGDGARRGCGADRRAEGGAVHPHSAPRRMRRTLLGFLLLVLAGCGTDAPVPDALGERPIRVVATTSLVADLAREIGGERVEVVSLMGPGVDPHLYNASEGDVGRMTRADLILYNGLHLEGKMTDVLARMGERAAAVTDAMDRARLLDSPTYAGSYDPHVWMDVALWQEAARAVAEGLAALDTAHAGGYHRRADAYLVRLDSLDAYVRSRAERVPAAQRVLVTAHDAFGYFGRAYGFEVRGLQGLSTATEAGTGDVQDLAAFIAERRIPALF